MERRRQAVLCLGCLALFSIYLLNYAYSHSALKETPISNSAHRRRQSSLLSIHLVIVPFLDFHSAASAVLLQREKEYKYVLQKNLDNPLVASVHILTTNATETQERFKGMRSSSKMVVAEVRSIDSMRDPWDYISQHLVEKDVMFANADIYLGHQFNYAVVDPASMARQNIMYALSRHVTPQERCGKRENGQRRSIGITDMNICLSGKYFGSHDAFLFRLHKPLSPEHLKLLEFALGSLGQENVLIWLFRDQLRYCVLNPCSILPVYHYHCSGLRNRGGKVRVNNQNNTGHAPYTNNLVCHA